MRLMNAIDSGDGDWNVIPIRNSNETYHRSHSVFSSFYPLVPSFSTIHGEVDEWVHLWTEASAASGPMTFDFGKVQSQIKWWCTLHKASRRLLIIIGPICRISTRSDDQLFLSNPFKNFFKNTSNQGLKDEIECCSDANKSLTKVR